MKHLLPMLLLFITLQCSAQSTETDPFMDRPQEVKQKPTIPFSKNDAGMVSFSDVVQLDSNYSAAKLFALFKEYFSSNTSNFNHSNKDGTGANVLLFGETKTENTDNSHKSSQPLKYADSDEKKVVGHIAFKYTGSAVGCIRLVYFEYDLILLAKDGRYKYDVTNFTYASYNHYTGKPSGFNTLKTSGPCVAQGTLENLLQCDNCAEAMNELLSSLKEDVSKLIASTKNYIITHKPTEHSDW